jgi:hypothetical protein
VFAPTPPQGEVWGFDAFGLPDENSQNVILELSAGQVQVMNGFCSRSDQTYVER